MHRRFSAVVAGVAALAASLFIAAPVAQAGSVNAPGALTTHQRAVLHGIARDTWRFFQNDVDPTTHLPLDNLGPGTTRGEYTSSANIGVYLLQQMSADGLFRHFALWPLGQHFFPGLGRVGHVRRLYPGSAVAEGRGA